MIHNKKQASTPPLIKITKNENIVILKKKDRLSPVVDPGTKAKINHSAKEPTKEALIIDNPIVQIIFIPFVRLPGQ